VLKGRTPEIKRTLFWRIAGTRPQQAVRVGDWKLLYDTERRCCSMSARIQRT
jgi:hypothetical protein